MHADGYDVHVSFKYIQYSEGERHLKFDREPGGDADPPAIIWFPSPKRWRETMPDWAQERRREILARIRAHAPPRDEWKVYYAAVDTVRDDDLSTSGASQ